MLHIPTWPMAWLASRFIETWLGTTMRKVAPKNQIGKIEAPLLLIHGETDHYIQPSNMETLYALAHPEYAERLMIPGRGHADIMRDVKCRQEIVAFFSKNLSLDDDHSAPLTSLPFREADTDLASSESATEIGTNPTWSASPISNMGVES